MVKYTNIEDVPFSEPKIKTIVIRGIEFDVYQEIPYQDALAVADVWIKSMTTGEGIDKSDLKDALNTILLKVVVSPKLNMAFIESKKCPNEFVGLAMHYFTEVIYGFGLLSSTDYEEEPEDETMGELD